MNINTDNASNMLDAFPEGLTSEVLVTLLEHAQGIAIIDVDGTVRFWNTFASQIFGTTPEDMVGSSSFDTIHPDDMAAFKTLLRNVTDHPGIPQRATLRCRAKNNKWLTIETTGTRLSSNIANGGIIVNYRDITEQVLGEQALRRSEERFLKVAHNAAEMFWELDLHNRYTYVSPAVQDLFGLTPEEIIGTKYYLSFHPDDCEAQRAAARSYSRDLQPFRHLVTRNIHKDGHEVWCSSSGMPVFDTKGRCTGYIGATVDITSIRKTYTALENSEATLRIALDAINDVVWDWNYPSGIVKFSSRWITLVGGNPPSESHIDEWAAMVHPDEKAEILRILDNHIEGHSPDFKMEYRLKTAYGWKWVEDKGRIVEKDTDGKPVRIMGAITDITTRKENEEARIQSEKQLRTLIENSPDVIARFGTDLRHIYINPASEKLTGFKPDHFIGKSHRELGFPDYQCAFFEQAMHTVFETGTPLETEYDFQSPHGPSALNWRIVPEIAPDGTVTSILSMTRDVTEQRRLEKNYRMLFNGMLDGFAHHEIICDYDGDPVDYRFLAVNPAFEQFVGLKASDILGKTVLEVLPDTEDFWIKTYGEVALTGKPARFENYAVALNKHFEVVAFCPSIGQFACIFQDVTSRKNAEIERSEAVEQLLQLQKMEAFGKLAGGVAHDFNNMLSIILGNASIAIEDTPTGFPGRPQLERIIEASKRARDLTSSLLTFARKKKPEFKPVDPEKLVDDSLAFISRTISKKIRVSKNVSPGLRMINIDLGQIVQVIVNICNNAVDAMPNGGDLTVTVKKASMEDRCNVCDHSIDSSAFCLISISDTGTGIPQTEIHRVFEPFYTTKDVGKGTGLGLSVSLGIVQNHGGHIFLRSGENSGTTVNILLPYADYAIDSTEEASTKTTRQGSETLLIVDDEPMMLAVARDMLVVNGYSVITASNGAEAMGIFRSSAIAIDLVILDMMMPDMDGAEVFELLRESNPTQKILIASGYSEDSQGANNVPADISGFIQKPFDPAELTSIVREILDAPPSITPRRRC